MFGEDATAPDSGFNRIIGEGKIRERKRRKKEEERESDIGTEEKAKPACYCSSLSLGCIICKRATATRLWLRCRYGTELRWRRRSRRCSGIGGGSQLPWMT